MSEQTIRPPLSNEDLHRLADEVSGVCSRLLSAHQLATIGITQDEDAACALEGIQAIIENGARVLDACVLRMGGTPTGNFDAILRNGGEG